MVKVDWKGRIVIPQEVRDELGMALGTEVDIHTENGKAVVEPEDNPEQVLERMDQLVKEMAATQGDMTPLDEGADPISKRHREAVRRGAQEHSDE